MPFIKENTNPNFSISTVHRFAGVESSGLEYKAIVDSYANMQAFQAGMLNWQQRYTLPTEHAGNPQAYLIGELGPFAGAQPMDETSQLSAVQSVRLAVMKNERDRRRVDGFAYLGKVFDSNQDAVTNISLAEKAAAKAVAEGFEDWSIDWTLKDNAILTMDAQQVLGMSAALWEHGSALHIRYNAVKTLIYANGPEGETEAEAVARINSIQWYEITPA